MTNVPWLRHASTENAEIPVCSKNVVQMLCVLLGSTKHSVNAKRATEVTHMTGVDNMNVSLTPDCRNTLKCENEKCVDPCACAQFADCTPHNHRGICTCFPDYTGNPYGIACDPSKIFTSKLLKNRLRLMIVFSSTWASCGRPRVQYWCWMSEQASLFWWRLLKSMSAYPALRSECWVRGEKWTSSTCNGVHLQTWLHGQGRWEMWTYK